MNDKTILAIETSGELCSASISFSPNKFDERNILMKHVHSEKLIPMINDLLKSNSIEAKQLFCVAISMGPGSFTGLRIGMTAAKGIAFAAEIPIVPVPTFDAFALELFEYLPDNTKFSIMNNANIEECYVSKFVKLGDSVKTLHETSLLEKGKTSSFIEENEVIFGNYKGFTDIRNISSPKASSIAKWTYLFGQDLLTFNFEYLEPNYLKKFKVK